MTLVVGEQFPSISAPGGDVSWLPLDTPAFVSVALESSEGRSGRSARSKHCPEFNEQCKPRVGYASQTEGELQRGELDIAFAGLLGPILLR